MDITEMERFADNCFRDAPPPCSCVCPFGLDVRKFMEKIRRGSYPAAYRQYRESVIFPDIVSQICPAPCTEACVRARLDRGVALRSLEAACVSSAKSTPTKYSIMPKHQHIAVVGAGLAGLACTLRLATRGYQVSLFEREERPGGRVTELLEKERCLAEIHNQMQIVNYDFHPGVIIERLDQLPAGIDAVFIATGAGGEDFGLLTSGYDPLSLATSRSGVFLGGMLAGTDLASAIGHGTRAALSIGNFLMGQKTDGMLAAITRPQIDQRFYALDYGFTLDTQVDAGEGDFDLQHEAERCAMCNCSLCRDSCLMMDKINKYPRRMCSDVIATLRPIEQLTKRIGSRMINTCSFCGKCGQSCPVGIDMGDCLDAARKALFLDGHLPAVYHEYWLRDMDFSLSDEAYLCWRPQEEKTSEICFFPGCQLGGSRPEYVERSYEYLRQTSPNAALLLSCCGVPADWAGDEARRDEALQRLRRAWQELGQPLFIIACPSCQRSFEKYLTEISCVSLYQWMDEHPQELPAPAVNTLRDIAIFHPCAATGDQPTRDAVISLISRCGLRSHTAAAVGSCCGTGGHIYGADPELAQALADRVVTGTRDQVAVYCANCRDLFASVGGQACHVLDLVFALEDCWRKPPTLSERRANRVLLKQHCLDLPGYPVERMQLVITDELQKKLDRLLILTEDVEMVIARGEESGRKLWDDDNDCFVSHLQIGYTTYWVAYTYEGDVLYLKNAYTHRLQIKE